MDQLPPDALELLTHALRELEVVATMVEAPGGVSPEHLRGAMQFPLDDLREALSLATAQRPARPVGEAAPPTTPEALPRSSAPAAC